MGTSLLLGLSFDQWWRGAQRELTNYFNNMDVSHWGVIAAMCVMAGFLLLRTTALAR